MGQIKNIKLHIVTDIKGSRYIMYSGVCDPAQCEQPTWFDDSNHLRRTTQDNIRYRDRLLFTDTYVSGGGGGTVVVVVLTSWMEYHNRETQQFDEYPKLNMKK